MPVVVDCAYNGEVCCIAVRIVCRRTPVIITLLAALKQGRVVSFSFFGTVTTRLIWRFFHSWSQGQTRPIAFRIYLVCQVDCVSQTFKFLSFLAIQSGTFVLEFRLHLISAILIIVASSTTQFMQDFILCSIK